MDVLMPQLGETVAEGKITTWFKAVGDAVRPGENLFEIETDKVAMEVPAITGGVLAEIRVNAGEVASVGTVVAVIAGEGERVEPAARAERAAASPPPVAANVQVQPSQPAARRPRADAQAGKPLDPFRAVRTPERNFGPARLASGVAVTPLARRLAAEGGIDLARISGSGPQRRIVARDVAAALAAAAQPAPLAAGLPGLSGAQVRALYRDVPHEEVALDGMRRTIAHRLVEAVQTVPHFYLSANVEIERLLRLRDDANAATPTGADGEPDLKLSITDFIVKAWALALQRVPAANAVWAEDRILRLRRSDIGVAVAVAGGLLTPVLRGAEARPLSSLSVELKDLVARARARRLKPEEYQGGSTAISNLGMFGVHAFSAVINPPHATILAVGAGQRRPVERADGGVRFASQMTVTLSCDHRVVDGALGAELLAAFRALIENPVTMLV